MQQAGSVLASRCGWSTISSIVMFLHRPTCQARTVDELSKNSICLSSTTLKHACFALFYDSLSSNNQLSKMMPTHAGQALHTLACSPWPTYRIQTFRKMPLQLGEHVRTSQLRTVSPALPSLLTIFVDSRAEHTSVMGGLGT